VLCEPEDAKSLADALESVLLDGQKRERLTTSGMTRVRTEYTATKMAEKFEAVLMNSRLA
jgi:glycosyltransferase involved in cell wall biosynthesis